MTATACRHDDGDVRLSLQAERIGSNLKMAVENTEATWSSGDSLWINGDTYVIGIDGSGHATTLVPQAESYRAVFPASIASSATQVNLPHEYHYAKDAQNRQLLALPMVASSNGENLFFYHLTGAIIVKFVNRRNETVTVDRVTVSSNSYALCGARSITFGDTAQTPLLAANEDDKSVTVHFDRQETTVAAGDTLAVLVPVAPVGSSNLFTIEVSTHVEGNRYTVSNTQQTQHSLVRNALGYAYMAVENSVHEEALFQGNNTTMHINTANDLLLMQKAINNGWTNGNDNDVSYSSYSYLVNSNIDMAGVEIEPISGFTGASFSSNNKTIRNLTIRSHSAYCSLFDTITPSTTISDITLQNISLISEGTSDTRTISPLVGYSTNNTNVYSGIHIDGVNVNIIGEPSGDIYFGGIVAITNSAITLNQCSFDGDVSLNSNAQLFYGCFLAYYAGDRYIDLSFISCSNNDTIHAILNAGTIIYAGGISGYTKTAINNINGHHGLINFTLSTSGTLYAGGFIARLNHGSSTKNDINLSNTPSVSGVISYTGIPSAAYIGTVYGRGRQYYLYNISVNTGYDATNLIIPANNGTIYTGNPSYQ